MVTQREDKTRKLNSGNGTESYKTGRERLKPRRDKRINERTLSPNYPDKSKKEHFLS